MSLCNRVCIPGEKESADRQHADSNAFDAAQYSGLEIELEPSGAAEGKYEHRHI